MANFVNSELGTDGYSVRDPLPDTPASREDIRGALGVQQPAVIRAMDEGKHIYTVDEMIAIAFVGNVDVAHMLTPTNDVLMLETEFRASYPIPGEISALDWIMWISNLKPLPGLDAKDYLVNTSLPAIQRKSVNGKIKQLGDAGAHIKKRTRLPMSTSKALKSIDPDAGKVLAIRA